MLNTQNVMRQVATIGEEIGLDLGQAFVETFQKTHPNRVAGWIVGREILERIMNQHDCAGVKFLNAIDESGNHTLVYAGADSEGGTILNICSVNDLGNFENRPAIVADRIKPVEKPGGGLTSDSCDWEWTID